MKAIYILIFFLSFNLSFSQHNEEDRIKKIEEKLLLLSSQKEGLLKTVNFNVKKTKLPDFVSAIANLHQVDIGIDYGLNNIELTNNFSEAPVKDILLYLCKEYDLTLDFTGEIISVKKYHKPKEKYVPNPLKIKYDTDSSLISFELKKDSLFRVFKEISIQTGKNLVFAPGMENVRLTSFINKLPLDNALEKMAFTNNLDFKKTLDHHYVFEQKEIAQTNNNNSNSYNRNSSRVRPQRNVQRYQNANFYFQVNDTLEQLLEVDFVNTPISDIIENIGHDLKINSFTTAPLDNAGKATVTAKNISFDELLDNILEHSSFSYKKSNGFYFFGDSKQAQIHQSIIVPLKHRSIEVFETNSSGGSSFSPPSFNGFNNYSNGSSFNNNSNSSYNNSSNYSNNQRNNDGISSSSDNYNSSSAGRSNSYNRSSTSGGNSFQSLIPQQYLEGLEIKVDTEMNSFIVEGPYVKVKQFKDFVNYIDKPVPVVLIEVMILETRKSLNVDTGIELGIGDAPTGHSGKAFPNADAVTLGAKQINRIIGGLDDTFGLKNLGQVSPNFYARIKALEKNGVLDIKSTPKLATLNSHSAHLSIGQTTYYAVTQRNVIGTQNPQTSEITNYYPINAQLGIDLTPLVAADGSITLSINVIQSDFNDDRVNDEAPPGISSKEFSSSIRVYDNDMVILGGLEKQNNVDSNSGVPILSRIPLLKYLFSFKSKQRSKEKFSILIKPTIIQ